MIFIHNYGMEIFGEKLKELRKEKGMSQEALSNAFNLSRTAIHGWEKDKQEPSLEDLKKLANYFGVTTDYLLGNTDEFGNPTTPQKKDLPMELPVSREEFRKHIEATELAKSIYALPKEKQDLVLKIIKDVISGIK